MLESCVISGLNLGPFLFINSFLNCFMTIQQLKVISASTRCEQFTIVPTWISWQTHTQKKLNHCYTLPWHRRDTVVPMYLNQINGRQNSLLSSCTTCVLVERLIQESLWCFHDEYTHVNCPPTSLLDHFVMTSKTTVIHKQKVPL